MRSASANLALHSDSPLVAPSDELLALAEVGRELTQQRELRPRLERAMHVLERRLSASCIVLCLADAEHRTLEVQASSGLPARAIRPRYGQGVIGRVAETGRPIVVPSVPHEAMAMAELPELLPAPSDLGSLICVPLSIGGQPAGALSVYFAKNGGDDFRGRLEVLEVVASLMSQALHAAHLESLAPSADSSDEPSVYEYTNMIGASVAMRQVYEQVGHVARTNATVLIRGESGTGKELVAEAIHQNSLRARQPFVKVNCAALAETLIESELFGHERGAFTGAHARRKGRFELAQGGTLFLDEIGDVPVTTQAKLLRVLQFREFERLGGTETLRADVRLVAATNRNMEHAIANGGFREDLYYRLDVFTITLPPLRERTTDIVALADYFLTKYAKEHHRRVSRLSNTALELLRSHPWPGNVRELENVIERAVVVCDGFVIQERHLPDALRSPKRAEPEALTLADAVEKLERSMIEAALSKAGGNATRAARELGTTERIVRYKAQKYGIPASRVRSASAR